MRRARGHSARHELSRSHHDRSTVSNPRRSPPLVAAVVLAAAPAARAHHSAAAYDTTQTISLEGVVTRYEWENPHVYIWLAAPGADGETVEWEVEGQPPAMLRRMGWSQDTFKVGDTIQATGNPARNARAQKSAARLDETRRHHAVRRQDHDERAHHVRCGAGSRPPTGSPASGSRCSTWTPCRAT